MPTTQNHVRILRESAVGEVMARVPAPYLELMFWNLAFNAYSACAGQDNRTIRVSIQQDGGMIVVSLRDDGAGLTQRELMSAFRPMTGSKPGHLHLGLCAARRLAEAYGGSLELESKKGEGTVVIVKVPAARK
jgi:two-component system sporulation sensor kinase B